ncbi:hard-surface induced [Fusarium longipes]|uniref:Hard-surface induced n=1 Tax=Fusarium longipes TaxID=694270 RepID=A0A395SZB6_9HYPO|nr:hard-surface induced [Fusarium longipes]
MGKGSALDPLPIETNFASIAYKNGINGTTIEDYDLLVKRYIQPLQSSPVRMLELGMGCRRTPVIQNLYRTWQEYLPNTWELLAVESKSFCTDSGADRQEDINTEAFLNLVYTWEAMAPAHLPPQDGSYYRVEATQLAGKFDIIIDSGFHRFQHQIEALEAFWKQVTPGGIYVLMDPLPTTLTSKYLHTLLANLVWTSPEQSISCELRNIDCNARFCVLTND